METLQKNLITFVTEGLFTTPVYNTRSLAVHKVFKGVKTPLLAWHKKQSLQKQKAETIRWFHLLINMNLVTLLLLGCFLPIPASFESLYHWVCLAAGWIFYYTMNRWVIHAINPKPKCSEPGYLPVAGLQGLAGYSRQTRLVLMIFLVIAVIATFAAHTSFALLVGFSLRWLIESQVLELIPPTKNPTNKANAN